MSNGDPGSVAIIYFYDVLGLSPRASYHQEWEKWVRGQRRVKESEGGLKQLENKGPSGCLTEQVLGELDSQTGCDPDFHIDG